MKAEELRLGNWVKGRKVHGEPMRVIEISEGGVICEQYGGYACSMLEGIPITPEWLERLGWERRIGLTTNDRIWLINGEGYYAVLNDVILHVGRLRFKHVHRLQNWMAETYHALTGSELKEKT